MKYKIFIDSEASLFLEEWGKTNKRFVIGCPPLSKKFEIIFCLGKKQDYILYAEYTLYGYKYRIKETDGKTLVKGKIFEDENGASDYKLEIDISDALTDFPKLINHINEVVSGICNSFLLIVAYLMYGNILGEKEYIAAGRNEGGTKVITFRKHNETVYAIHTTAHRSPEGVFSVRGHFRHYKSGKIIWIDEYLKGVDKDV